MKVKLIILSILFASSLALAMPTAQEARRQSDNNRDTAVLHDVILLTSQVDQAINEAVKIGSYTTNPNVSQYPEETIHIVNQHLRSLGYKCETIMSINGFELDVISWDRE